MSWLILLVIVVLYCKERESARRPRETRRLLRQFGAEDWKPSPEPPSPHRLLGEIARPIAPACDRRSAVHAFGVPGVDLRHPARPKNQEVRSGIGSGCGGRCGGT